MNTPRLYSLPNCVLELSGLEAGGSFGAARPLVSVLLGARCRFPAHNMEFECDRPFFERFARTVSLYAQEVLSGVRSPELRATDLPPHQRAGIEQPPIELRRAESGPGHRLIVRPPALDGGPTPPELDLELSLLQLYDLVETIDQFYTDTKTLPDVSLSLSAVSRRYRDADRPLVERAMPLAVGAAGLAIAAGTLVLLPLPKKIAPPEDRFRNPQELNTAPIRPGQSPGLPGTPPNPQSSPQKSSQRPVSPLAQNHQKSQRLSQLQAYVQGRLDRAWNPTDRPSHPLSYRVTANAQGQLVGYQPLGSLTASQTGDLPLRGLLVNPLDRQPDQAAIASFRVTFTPDGRVATNLEGGLD